MQEQKETAHPFTNAPLNQNNKNDSTHPPRAVNEIRVSTVKSATSTETTDHNANAVLEAIRTGGRKLRGQIEQIRDKSRYGDASAKLLAQELKKQLPAVMWSGTFTERKNEALVKHSGLLCADLDKLGDTLPDAWDKLRASPHVWAMFTSPSGDGLKAVFRVSPDPVTHGGSFRAIEKHVPELTGVRIDQSCKDPARLCFLSYDPELYHNPSAVPIEPLPEPEKSPRPLGNGAVDLSARQRIAEEILGAIEWESKISGLTACPGKDRHTTSNNARDCKIELDNVPTVHCFHNSCHGVLDGVNHTLRSRIGKAEYAPDTVVTETPSTHEREASSYGDGDAAELPQTPAPYTPPPLDLLPADLRECVEAASKALHVDVAYVLLPLLSSLGSAIGDSRSVQLKRGYIEPPIIWTGIIGASGQKKSPGVNDGCFAVMDHERELVKKNREAEKEYATKLNDWWKQDKERRNAKPEPPVKKTCLTDDTTLEKLAETMHNNPHGVLLKKDELSHWFASFDQYTGAKGADVSRWLSLHTGVLLGIDRKSDHQQYRIFNPRVCITGGIQPEVLKRVLTRDFFERGLPQRFIFAAPPKRAIRWSDDVVPVAVQKAASELFKQLWDLRPDDGDTPQPELLTLEADAKGVFVTFYNECGTATVDGDEHTEAAFNKLPAYAARLALVAQLAHNPGAKTITGEVMKAACAFARWAGNETKRIYASVSETPAEREQRQLIGFIQKHDGLVSVRDVTHGCRAYRKQPDEAERVLGALVKNGFGEWDDIKPDQGSKGGRPTRKFRLLEASPSPKPLNLPSKTLGYGDGDRIESMQNTVFGQPKVITVTTEKAASSNGLESQPNGEDDCPECFGFGCPSCYQQEALIAEATALLNATPAA